MAGMLNSELLVIADTISETGNHRQTPIEKPLFRGQLTVNTRYNRHVFSQAVVQTLHTRHFVIEVIEAVLH